MEFPWALDRSRPAPCKRGDQIFGNRSCQSKPYARSSGQREETRVEDNEDSTDPELGHGDHHVPCGRSEAELFVPRPARHYVRHHEAVFKDVSAGRTRLEEP